MPSSNLITIFYDFIFFSTYLVAETGEVNANATSIRSITSFLKCALSVLMSVLALIVGSERPVPRGCLPPVNLNLYFKDQ